MENIGHNSIFVDNAFSVIGDVDATKKFALQVDTQATASTLTLNVGAQTTGRTLTLPVMSGNRTLAVIDQDNLFTAAQSITGPAGLGVTILGAALTFGQSPDLRFRFTGDADAAFSFLNYAHDNISVAYDAYFNGTNWIASSTSSVLLSKGSGQLSFFVNIGLTKGSSHPATNFAMALRDATVTASSSLTGTLVIGDAVTAATNVGIGGGVINAGTSIVCKAASGTANFSADTTTTSAQCGYRWSDSGTLKWILDKAPDQNLYVFDAANGVNMLQFTSGTASAGHVNLLNTTTSSSSITGALVIGDGSTTATNVGIGGGKVTAGTQFYVKVTGTSNGAVTIDSTSAGTQVGMTLRDNTTDQWILYKPSGNTTLRIFDAVNAQDMLIFTQGTAPAGFARFANTTTSSTSITGGLIIGDGITVATNVGIGGGNVNAGGTLIVAGAAQLNGGTAASVTTPGLLLTNNRIISWRDSAAGFTNAGFVWYDSTNNLNFGTSNNTRMQVLAAGAIVIGASDPGGTDQVRINGALTISSATMIQTKTAFTNNAAAGVGTITNAPVAGNPTKWIPINDNGTIRNIPAW